MAVRLSTANDVGVNANRVLDTELSGTAIPRGLRLAANDGRAVVSSSLAGPAERTLPAGPVSGARFAWQARVAGGGIAGTLGDGTAGAQEYTLRLLARQDVQGSLLILVEGRAAAATANGGVVVGGEGRRFAIDGTAQRDTIPGLTVGSAGLDVRVLINGSARAAQGANAGYSANLSVFFVPDAPGGGGCFVRPHEDSCAAGGTLRGAVRVDNGTGQLGLGLSGALPSAIGLTVVSRAGDFFTIGNTNCIFFRAPIVGSTFNTDASGNARSAFRFPVGMNGFRFYAHQATVVATPRGVRFATSNSLEVGCR